VSVQRSFMMLAVLSSASAAPLLACRCRPSTFPAQFERAPLVLLGRVVRTDSLAEIVIVVEEQFKGPGADTLRLRRTDSSCEYFDKMPSVGARHLLLIGTHNGPMTVGECSGSARLEERQAELGWLRSRRRAV
jgi:hypothetical protein